MKTNRLKYTIAFKIVLLTTGSAGLYLNSGLPQGAIRWSVLNYYTIQSNILCMAFILAALTANLRSLRRGAADPSFHPRLEGAVVFAITVTMLIYRFVLVPYRFSMGSDYAVYSPPDLVVHFFVPLLMILDWVLFARKGTFRPYDPVVWLSVPYAYFLFVVVRARLAGPIGTTGSAYPYRFIDVEALGWHRVLGNVAVLSLIFLAVGMLFLMIDRVAGRKKKIRPEDGFTASHIVD